MTVLHVECPTCGSPQFRKCRDMAGEDFDFPVRFHKQRLDLAKQLTNEQNGMTPREAQHEAMKRNGRPVRHYADPR